MSSVTVSNGTQAGILTNPDAHSVKRIAWAFGCARKGSDEEAALYRVLRERFAKMAAERGEHG